MRYPQAFVDAVRDQHSPSEVIGRRIPVKRAGREFHALCPFHNEKTPSFTINDEKGFYHCFGCGAHGDVFTFLKDYEGISYREAIEKLAEEAGMSLPKPTKEAAAREKRQLDLQDVVEMATSWFEQQLYQPQGDEARDYLVSRGLSDEIIARFRIGFAPDEREKLRQDLKARGVSDKQMVDAGLLIQLDNREPYARFRGRIMFPIRTRQSKVVAFGGRILPALAAINDKAPKYLNSPETELFHKGHMLFNLDLARRAAHDSGQLLLAEGYMDVIALAQAGIDYAVAPLGTSVTPEQVGLMWRLVDVPVVCLDGDNAGERAMHRVADLALPQLQPGKSLRFARLPRGEDPDSLIRQRGRDAFDQVITQATPLADVVWYEAIASGMDTPEQRAGVEASLMARMEKIADETVKSHYRSHMKQRLWEAKSNANQKNFDKNASRTPGMLSGHNGAQQAVKLPPLPAEHDQRQRALQAVRQLVALAILYPSLLSEGGAEEVFARVEVTDGALDSLRQAVLNQLAMQPGLDRASLRAGLESRGKAEAADMVLRKVRDHLPRRFFEDDEAHYVMAAQHSWERASNAYHVACIMGEFKQAEAELAADMSEAGLVRFMELRAQLDALERDRDRLYREGVPEAI